MEAYTHEELRQKVSAFKTLALSQYIKHASVNYGCRERILAESVVLLRDLSTVTAYHVHVHTHTQIHLSAN